MISPGSFQARRWNVYTLAFSLLCVHLRLVRNETKEIDPNKLSESGITAALTERRAEEFNLFYLLQLPRYYFFLPVSPLKLSKIVCIIIRNRQSWRSLWCLSHFSLRTIAFLCVSPPSFFFFFFAKTNTTSNTSILKKKEVHWYLRRSRKYHFSQFFLVRERFLSIELINRISTIFSPILLTFIDFRWLRELVPLSFICIWNFCHFWTFFEHAH